MAYTQEAWDRLQIRLNKARLTRIEKSIKETRLILSGMKATLNIFNKKLRLSLCIFFSSFQIYTTKHLDTGPGALILIKKEGE